MSYEDTQNSTQETQISTIDESRMNKQSRTQRMFIISENQNHSYEPKLLSYLD